MAGSGTIIKQDKGTMAYTWFWMLLKKQINLSGGFFAINNEEYEGIYHKNVNRMVKH
jgi:hypothetical protein